MDCSCWSLTQGTRGRQPGPRLEEASMPLANSDVLISGAGVAGPTLAYWLVRYSFTPTVIERTPALRAGLGRARGGPVWAGGRRGRVDGHPAQGAGRPHPH